MASVDGSKSLLASSDEVTQHTCDSSKSLLASSDEVIQHTCDGSKSLLASSDEVIQHTCGPCKDEGDTKEANYFCENCKEYLCFDCRNDHKKFKATKKHSVVPAHVTQGTDSVGTGRTISILCSCDQKQIVDIYCENHTEVICTTCETIKHRNCKTCPIKTKVNKDTEKKFKKLMTRAASLKVEFKNCKDDEEDNRTKVESQREKFKKEIAAFRRKINDALDRMENGTVENVVSNSNQQLRAIDKRIAAIETSQKALNTSLDIIDSASKSRKTEIMFSATVKLSKSLSEYDYLLNEMKNETQLPKLKFYQNETLLALLEKVENLGRIETVDVGANDKRDLVILDKKVNSTKEVNIQLSDDDLDPQITGCTVLSDGRILLCDYNNNKVKMLDRSMVLTKSLKMPETPYSVVATRENEAIITFDSQSDNDFQYIYAHTELILGKKITGTARCRRICVVGDAIYTTHLTDAGQFEIWKLDNTGNMIDKLVLIRSSSPFGDLSFGLCLTGPSPRVYLTDSRKAEVTCFQLDGKKIYTYEDEELKAPGGIYVDSIGNCLVCDYVSQNVVVITANGLKYEELLKFNDSTCIQPRCIGYRPQDNTLIVGCANTNNMFAYKLGK